MVVTAGMDLLGAARPSEAIRRHMDLRPAGRCPLCDRDSRPLDVFEFAKRPDLPTRVHFEFCAACNFVFAGDVSAAAYRRYYASIRNDEGHVIDGDEADSDAQLQAALIRECLDPGFAGRVFDFGCGQGRLLAAVARLFPDATFYGHDVADFTPAGSDIRFVATLDDLEGRFDMIVVSHVLEHLVSFEILNSLERLLALGGRLYVEVPNPLEYGACPRREYLYYFDRLHINHFGTRAMQRLLDRCGLETLRRGTHRFRYRDGFYPAMYHVATRVGDRMVDVRDRARLLAAEDDEDALDVVYRAYRDDESHRAAELRRRLAIAGGPDGVLVYGAGDNFRRSRRPGGPLHGLRLLAVMDRRAREIPAETDLAFELPGVALARFPEAPVVVTTSQGSGEIAGAIRASWPARPVFIV